MRQPTLPVARHHVHSYTRQRARRCVCGEIRCPGAHGVYWVSVRRDNGDTRFLAGPYETHMVALAKVREANDRACALDPRAHWYAFGTARTDTENGYTAIFGCI